MAGIKGKAGRKRIGQKIDTRLPPNIHAYVLRVAKTRKTTTSAALRDILAFACEARLGIEAQNTAVYEQAA